MFRLNSFVQKEKDALIFLVGASIHLFPITISLKYLCLLQLFKNK